MFEPHVLLEDGPVLGVCKPAGLLTQGVPGGLPTAEAWARNYLREKYQKPGNVYLGIPHRLDRPVSGVMIFARNSKAAARLAEQFRERQVRKWYECVVSGCPEERKGLLRDWLLKDAERAHVTVVPAETPGARHAELRYEVVAESAGKSLLRVELLTGRMHQIRVQLANIGCPILGDTQYGSPWPIVIPDGVPTAHNDVILLHAARLEFRHPVRYDDLVLTADRPDFWHTCGHWTPTLQFDGSSE